LTGSQTTPTSTPNGRPPGCGIAIASFATTATSTSSAPIITSARFVTAVAAAGFTVKRTLVWFKGGGGIGDLEGDYIHETEFIVFAHKGRRPLDGRRRGNVFQVPKIPPGALLHPTQKPAGVIRPLIQKSSRAGDVVLDPFAGSGTTGVVAVEEGRGYVMIEQDPQYIEVAQRRLAQGGLFSEGALP
jgi:DNA modification methylase